MRALLELLQAVGEALSRRPGALERAWGRHLLQDWASLSLLSEKFEDMDEVRREQETV